MLKIKNKYYYAFIPVMLTIFIAQQFSFINAMWAGISAHVVFLTTTNKTIEKAIFRILGTVLGGFLALLIVNLFHPNIYIIAILVFCLSYLGLHYNNTTRHGYFWVYFSFIFFIVLSHSISDFYDKLNSYAHIRMISVIFGSFVTSLFNYIFLHTSNLKTFIKENINKENIKKYFTSGYKYHFNKDLFFYNLSGSLALAIIVFIGKYFSSNIFYQAGTSIMFIMNVPFNNVKSKGLKEIYKKICFRFLGAATGVSIGAISFIILAKYENFFYFSIAIASIVSLTIRNITKVSYWGLQVFVAYAFTMLPKPLDFSDIPYLFSRCLGIFVAFFVIILSNFIMMSLKNFIYRDKN